MFRIEDTDAQIRKLGLWFVIISLHFFSYYFYNYYYWIFFSFQNIVSDEYLFGSVQ